VKWYHKPAVVIIALLALGPFALPLVWMSPAFTRPARIVMTILVIAITVWLVKASLDIFQVFMNEMQSLQNLR